MTRTQRLQPVVRHTDKKQQRALQAFAKSQGLLQMEQDRLDLLNNYRREYLSKRNQQDHIYSSIELQEYHRFLVQLEDTISKQQLLVDQRRHELDQKRDSWNETRIDSKMMHKVVDNLQRQELFEQDRNEQKALDDISQRRKILI